MKKLRRKLTAVVLAAVVALAGMNFGGIGGLTVAAAETTGAFTVMGGTKGTDYEYVDGVLTIKTDTSITIKNIDLETPTADRIEVADGVYANITLAGVNIDVSSFLNDTAAFKIADHSTGNVTITLADDSENTLKSGNNCAGLQKNGDTSTGTLTIKGGTNGTGTLNATGGVDGAGIGGGNGAGIGGGYCGSGSNIKISGGTVTATGGENGAGIGGGNGAGIDGVWSGFGSNIKISGGTVTATGGKNGAGIGGGQNGSGSNIEISGGTVTASGYRGELGIDGGAGIGGGVGGSGSDITISGGTVTATGHESGAGIGGGTGGSGSDITISGGTVTASGGNGAGIGGGMVGSGSGITISGGTVTATGGENGAGIGGGKEGSGSDITISGGTVTASGYGGAGIGGGRPNSGSNIEISGGTVTASGRYGAGIGGGWSGSGSNITISGGTVTASSHQGAGIGGGRANSGSNIEISGGSVKAVAGTDAHKIGGGTYGGEAVTPTSDGSTHVYLLEIKNEVGAAITINDTPYPTNHNGENKIYAYLPAKTLTDPNVVTVGTETKKYVYDNSQWRMVPTVTAPTPNELAYTGTEQALVTKGTTSDGTIVYSLNESGEYSEDIPTGTVAKTYTVWYKVNGGGVCVDTLPASVEVTITQATPKITNADIFQNQSTVYGSGEFTAPTVDADGTFEYKADKATYNGEELKTYLKGKNVSDSPVAVGYTFKPTDTTNYKEVTGTISFTIEKAGSSVGTAPKAKEKLIYDGSAQALVSAGSDVTGGTLQYSTSRDGVYSETIPTGTDAKEYSVWYQVVGDANHTDTEPAEMKVTIAPRTIKNDNTIITLGEALTYTGAEQTQTVSSVTCNNLPVTYTVSGNTGTNADNYTLTVTGTGNFTGTATTNFTISKKSLTGTDQTLLVKKNQAKDITYDLSKLLPESVTGETTYAVGAVTNDNGVLSSAPTAGDIRDGKLTLHVASVADADQTAIVQITFTNSNYDISTATLTVKTTNKTPVNLFGVTCGNRVYNGTAYTYTGTPVWKTEEGETATGETTVKYYTDGDDAQEVAPTNAGSYRAVFYITSDAYEGTATYNFEITKAQITVAAKNKNIYVGDAVPDLTAPKAGTDYTVTGLYGTDALGGTAAMSYAQKPDNTKTGTYEILISGLTAPVGDNYTITFTNGTLTITTKPSGGGSSSGGSSGGGSSSGGSSGGTADKPADSGTTTTTTNKDGSTTTTTTETDANGNTVTTTTTVATDGSTTEKVQATQTNAAGKEVEVTTTTKTDANGNVTGVTEKTAIDNIAKDTTATVTVKTDGDGNVTSAKASITKTSDSSKVSLSGKVLGQITEAAGADTKVRVTMTVKDREGNTKYKVQANAEELVPNEKLYIYKLDTKTGTYTMVNAKEYKVTKAGTVTVNMTKKATYELVTAKESKAITKEIVATVKPAKSSKNLSEGKKTTFKLSAKLDMDNVKSITYATSKKSIATVTKKGTITAVKAGTATVRATVTLKNGTKKTIKMTIIV